MDKINFKNKTDRVHAKKSILSRNWPISVPFPNLTSSFVRYFCKLQSYDRFGPLVCRRRQDWESTRIRFPLSEKESNVEIDGKRECEIFGAKTF